MNLTHLKEAARLQAEIRKVARRFNDRIILALPIGGAVEWDYQGHKQKGVVQHISYDRVRVYNSKTTRSYWIHLWRIFKIVGVNR